MDTKSNMSGNVIVAESNIHGLGVYAARDFEEGETILVRDESRVVDDEHPLRPELGEYERHCDYLAGGKVVLLKTPECNINSSCDPNVYHKYMEGMRHVVARRRMKSGEEMRLRQ